MIRLFCLLATLFLSAPLAAQQCVPPGRWLEPGAGEVDAGGVIARAARNDVLLLGETHSVAAHHTWQVDTLRALYALRPQLVIGVEMLPRRAQPALDAWVRGDIDEATLFERTDWQRVWGVPPALYAGIFRFAREHRLPMRALNVNRQVVRDVSRLGLAGVPPERREGVGDPADARPEYRLWLQQIWSDHMPVERRSDDAFTRFMQGQLLWDRAMAEALAGASRDHPQALVVGIMGSGHVIHGRGVEHQLRALGLSAIGSLLPWDSENECSDLVAGLADAVYGIARPLPGETH